MKVYIDSGPLFAIFSRTDSWHEWTVSQLKEISLPYYSCESVLSETFYLLNRHKITPKGLIALLTSRALIVEHLGDEESLISVCQTISKYHDLPASFADACLVRLAEKHPSSHIVTLDSDFLVYKTTKNKPLSIISPF